MTAATMDVVPPPQDDYPISVTFDTEQQINRLWGIPILGWTVRWLLVIPHLVVLWFLQLVVGLFVFVSWIPVLINGRQADIVVSLFVTTYRYMVRVVGWAFFMAGPYPPIVPGDTEYPINLDYDSADRGINRLWGIPLLGIYLRGLLVIPHAFLLFILYFPIAFLAFLSWIFILIYGRLPDFYFTLYGGFLRISARATLWVALVPAPYPPLRLS